MVAAWARTREAGIPFDVQWGDIDYMDRRLDFTLDQGNFAGLADFVAELHEMGMRFRIPNTACNKSICNAEKKTQLCTYKSAL